MVLSEISLTNFRSHSDVKFVFDPELTIISGKNGIGKTNALEAIYVLLRGGSFRSVTDSELTRFEAPWWRVTGVVDDSPRQVRFQPEKRPAKHLIVGDTTKRFMYRDRLPVVLFEPNDLLLIHGSPTRRRDAFDDMLGALSYEYKLALGRYERALKQRNNALKKYGQTTGLADKLFVWDVALAEYGENIIASRFELVERLNSLMPHFYAQISGKTDDISLRYESALPVPINSSTLLNALHKAMPLDTLRATTSVGPHRDDFSFQLNGSSAKQTASRGEVRSILLALKLAYAELLQERFETSPIMLFDDVFSELDADRQVNLLGKLNNHQTIITDTKDVRTKRGKQIRL